MSWLNELPQDLVSALKSETRGEVIRWAARPDSRTAFLVSFAIYVIAVPWMLISTPICGAMLAALIAGPKPHQNVSTFEMVATVFGFLFTLSFVLVGIGMLLMPFRLLGKARRTVFAVTDQRVLTLVEGRTRRVTTIRPEKILKLERTERRDGSGTGKLRIVVGHETDGDGDIKDKAEDFYGVPKVAEAERWVRALITRQHAA